MDPFFYKKLGKSNITLPKLGFGAAPLGELFEKVSEEQSSQTLSRDFAHSLSSNRVDIEKL